MQQCKRRWSNGENINNGGIPSEHPIKVEGRKYQIRRGKPNDDYGKYMLYTSVKISCNTNMQCYCASNYITLKGRIVMLIGEFRINII